MRYLDLQKQLDLLGLIFTHKTWVVTPEGSTALEATISTRSLNDTPTLIQGALHMELSASGKSPDEVATNLWSKITAKNAKILMGSYNNYHSKLEVSNGVLTKKDLDETERMVVNCPI